MKKRIVCTVTSDIAFDQRMDRICTSLTKAGFDVTIICRNTTNTKTNNKPYRIIQFNNLFSAGKLFYIEHNIKLFLRLLFLPYDLVCAIDLDTITPAYLSAKLRRKFIVYDAHEYFTEVIEVVKRPKIKAFWKRIEKWIVPNLKYAYTVSQSIADLYKQEYGTHFELIRNISFLENKTIKIDKDCDLIYIGVVNEGRGIEETIEAIKDTDVTLRICGKGDKYEELIKKVKQLNMNNQVEFKGFIQPHLLKEETKKAKIGMLILKNEGLSYYYSLANKFFDYVHAEIPQIVIDFPEYHLLNKQYEVGILTSNEPCAIKKSIIKLTTDRAFYDQLKQNTKQAKQDWNWQNEEKKLISFYKNILG